MTSRRSSVGNSRGSTRMPSVFLIEQREQKANTGAFAKLVDINFQGVVRVENHKVVWYSKEKWQAKEEAENNSSDSDSDDMEMWGETGGSIDLESIQDVELDGSWLTLNTSDSFINNSYDGPQFRIHFESEAECSFFTDTVQNEMDKKSTPNFGFKPKTGLRASVFDLSYDEQMQLKSDVHEGAAVKIPTISFEGILKVSEPYMIWYTEPQTGPPGKIKLETITGIKNHDSDLCVNFDEGHIDNSEDGPILTVVFDSEAKAKCFRQGLQAICFNCDWTEYKLDVPQDDPNEPIPGVRSSIL